MGYSDSKCKIHPEELRSPGVCSSCLRERLHQLCSISIDKFSAIGVDSCSYSHTPNSYDSPIKRLHRRNTSDVMNSSSVFVSSGKGLIKKSRSMVFMANRDGESVVKGGKKKLGFWLKLIRSTGRRRSKEILI